MVSPGDVTRRLPPEEHVSFRFMMVYVEKYSACRSVTQVCCRPAG